MSNVVVFAKCGRGDKFPIASFNHDHPMLAEMVQKTKMDQLSKWVAAGNDVTRCALSVVHDGVESPSLSESAHGELP